MEMESNMRPSITEHHALLVRYLMVFLIGYILLTVHAGADIRKKTNTADPVPQIEPGKAKLVDLASLPPQLRRTVDDEIKRLRAGRPAQAAPVREPTRSSSIRSKAAHAPAHASAISAGERTPARSACMKTRQRGPGPASSPCR